MNHREEHQAAVRGSVFGVCRDFVESHAGQSGYAAAVTRLAPQDQEVFRAMVPVGFYPADIYGRLLVAVDEVLGAGDRALLVKLGRYEAHRDLPAVSRGGRLLSPIECVERLGELWQRNYSVGEWAFRSEGEGRMVGELFPFSPLESAFCRKMGAWISGLFELTGATLAVSEHPFCRGCGDRSCVFAFRVFYDRRAEARAGVEPTPAAGRVRVSAR